MGLYTVGLVQREDSNIHVLVVRNGFSRLEFIFKPNGQELGVALTYLVLGTVRSSIVKPFPLPPANLPESDYPTFMYRLITTVTDALRGELPKSVNATVVICSIRHLGRLCAGYINLDEILTTTLKHIVNNTINGNLS